MDGVKLKALKIARARGKYYVYRRETGEVLLRGFKADKAALMKRLGEPDMLGLYNAWQKRAKKISYPRRSAAGRMVHQSGPVSGVQGPLRGHAG